MNTVRREQDGNVARARLDRGVTEAPRAGRVDKPRSESAQYGVIAP